MVEQHTISFPTRPLNTLAPELARFVEQVQRAAADLAIYRDPQPWDTPWTERYTTFGDTTTAVLFERIDAPWDDEAPANR